MTEYLPLPSYKFHTETKTGELTGDFAYNTPVTGHYARTAHVLLSTSGELSIYRGYRWDFGSGPAIDTPEMVAASLAHDALYDLLKAKLIPGKERKTADKYFRRLLKAYGVGWFRRNYCYWAVRLFGGPSAN